MSPKILVTGAAGFIGSAVTKRLSQEGWKVVALDGLLDDLYPADEKIARFKELGKLPGVERFHLDLRSDNLNMLPTDITHVINEAAMPGLSLSWLNFELYSSCNLGALSRLIEHSSQWNLQRFVQISTSSVYGKNAVGNEEQPTRPVSPYGVTKLAAEHLALAHWRDSGFPALILRYFSVYGPGQRPDMAYRKFINNALKGNPVTVYGSGEQSRSNTFIDDCVSATVAALWAGEPGEIFNIAGGQECTINQALEIVERESGRKLSLQRRAAARGDQERTFGDSSKAQSVLGFQHTVSLEEGLARQVRWQQNL